MGEHHKYLFSVIVPVYNTEPYIKDAVESLLGQTIGFEENIQLILVNDGSTDGSAAVCKKYAALYPDNIVYIEQRNLGVSKARNTGMECAEGKYLNFLDSDDKWSPGAFEAAAAYFENNPDIHIAAAKSKYFEAKSGDHPLNYKFETGFTADIRKNPDYVQCFINSVWIEKSIIGDCRFDPGLKYFEDAAFINRILLGELRYGVLKNPVYWYRRRLDNSSALNKAKIDKGYYLNTLDYFHRMLFDLSVEMYGYVLPYIQYTVMYILQGRFRNSYPNPLLEDEYDVYSRETARLLSQISDEIILTQRNTNRGQRLAVLALKYGMSIAGLKEHLCILRDTVYLNFDGSLIRLWGARQETRIKLQFLRSHPDGIYIEGQLYSLLPQKAIEILLKTSEGENKAEIFEREDLVKDTFFQERAVTWYGFRAVMPLKTFTLRLYLFGKEYEVRFENDRFFPLSDLPDSYALIAGKAVSREENKFRVSSGRRSKLLRRELNYEKSLRGNAGTGTEEMKSIKLRRRLFLKKIILKRTGEIWLISDRANLAGDNGEALFTYLQQHPVKGVKTYFVIRSDSPDYERMKKTGPVVEYFSSRHKRLHTYADKIISSAAEEYTINPFPELQHGLQGLPGRDFVFLQHGVIQDDLSGWLKAWKKDIKLFCTSAGAEYASIADNPFYGYSKDQVKLTGLARHDSLIEGEDKTEKKLLIAPTWRKYSALPALDGVRPYNPYLKTTDFFAFYDRLINDEDIRQTLDRGGYTAKLLLHPAFINNIEDFSSSYCEISTEYNYRDEFMTSQILLTDYSSVAFDFSILKKPVIYAQFDREEFFNRHLCSWGYYDYRTDGFGPVCDDYEQTKHELIEMIKNPVMEKSYADRVDSFFGALDGHACERITKEILRL